MATILPGTKKRRPCGLRFGKGEVVTSDDANAAMFLVELNRAVFESEQRPIPTGADICAGVDLGTALANDNVARDDRLTAELLHAKTLRVTLAAVGRC